MNSVVEFLRTFREFNGRHGRPTSQTPWDVVEEWEALVEDFAGGNYSWCEVEYTNDLQVRDLLEKALTDERLAVFEPQITAMRERITLADTRLNGLFLPDVQIGPPAWPWWQRGVLAHAGPEYTEDIRRIYGIELPGSAS
jgi:hypothetical protein